MGFDRATPDPTPNGNGQLTEEDLTDPHVVAGVLIQINARLQVVEKSARMLDRIAERLGVPLESDAPPAPPLREEFASRPELEDFKSRTSLTDAEQSQKLQAVEASAADALVKAAAADAKAEEARESRRQTWLLMKKHAPAAIAIAASTLALLQALLGRL